MLDALPRVAILSVGGTIASTGNSGVGVVPRLGAAELAAGIPQLRDTAVVEAAEFRRMPSGDLTFADLVDLAEQVRERISSGCSGVVITQGTDSIEETSFALDLLLEVRQPVVVTGAMRNPTLAGPDGPANVLAAVQVAAAPFTTDLGCLVVLNDEIHAARYVRKTNTSSPSTFRSESAGPLGWVAEGCPHVAFRPSSYPRPHGIQSQDIPAVALVTMCLGADGRLLEQIGRAGYSGLVVEGFGGGHVPARVVPILAELAKDVPVILASRTGSGSVLRTTYGFPGSERDLLDRGLIASGFLDGLKSRVLLTFLLAAGGGIDEVRAGFEAMDLSTTTAVGERVYPRGPAEG